MAGLSLNMSGFGAASAGSLGGSNLASVPSAAGSPSGPRITERAFGIGTSQSAAGPRTAAYGTMLAGAAGAALLVWLWWTLPR